MRNSKVAKIVLLAGITLTVAVSCTPLFSQKQQTSNSVNQESASNQSSPSTYTYSGENGKTALELLKQKFQVETKNYTGLGEFVTSINGAVADSAHFWSFYVNGVPATVGAGTYQTKAGESIEWKLEPINK